MIEKRKISEAQSKRLLTEYSIVCEKHRSLKQKCDENKKNLLFLIKYKNDWIECEQLKQNRNGLPGKKGGSPKSRVENCFEKYNEELIRCKTEIRIIDQKLKDILPFLFYMKHHIESLPKDESLLLQKHYEQGISIAQICKENFFGVERMALWHMERRARKHLFDQLDWVICQELKNKAFL